MKFVTIRNWLWILVGFFVPIGMSIWGYLSGAWVVIPAMAAAQVIILQAERFTLGPLFLDFPLFLYAGGVLLLYLLFLSWAFRKDERKFPFLVLSEGVAGSLGMFLFFGFSVMWTVPFTLLVYLFAAIFWLEQIFLTTDFQKS
ncbi:hypothetical protein IIB97_01225 [Patescibacteria group bacterium]|nr:hypothetical protein [Patescibacteria group bacterium]